MAITKMMHIKGSNGNNGLKRCISYIMNPEKTEDGLLIGSNSGNTPEEIFKVMMDTKEDWDKTDKRQGYHFVISWKPGEVSKRQAFEVTSAFCKEYLSDEYDYVFSVHTDQDHLHSHIVFNSVNRIDGHKYRYEKGDWERYIQPVTDQICKERGLPVLSREQSGMTSGSYAEYKAEKEGLPTLTKIVKADIDQMIQRSESFDQFLYNMKKLGYRIRAGKYITYYPPGFTKGRRDKTLGEGYTKTEITARILYKEKEDIRVTSVIDPKKKKYYDTKLKFYLRARLSPIQIRYVRIVYHAGHYLEAKNPFAVKWKEARKDAMEIDHIFRECCYLIDHKIPDVETLKKRYQTAGRKEKNMIRHILDRQENKILSLSKDHPEKKQELFQKRIEQTTL